MRILTALLVFLTTSALHAVDRADLHITELRTDKASYRTGERMSIKVRIANGGPDSADRVGFYVRSDVFALEAGTPAGWECEGGHGPVCKAMSMPAGTTATFRFTALAPRGMTADGTFVLWIDPFMSTDEAVPENDDRKLTLGLTPSANEVDARLLRDEYLFTAKPAAAVTTRPFRLMNSGKTDAHNVAIYASLFVDVLGTGHSLTASGDGWSCTPAMRGVLCSRPVLRAGETSAVTVQFEAPGRETWVHVSATFAVEDSLMLFDAHYDSITYGIGDPEDWQGLLFPVVDRRTEGAGGALWEAEITMLFRDNVRFRPYPCHTNECPDAPIEEAFDVNQYPVLDAERPRGWGQFLYVARDDSHDIRANIRVRDAARPEGGAGAEIPVVKDTEFTAEPITLLNVPAAPGLRSTLRIYDRDGRDGPVVIRVLDGDGAVRSQETVRLALPDENFAWIATNALQPKWPAFAQVDLTPLVATNGTLHLEIDAVDPSVRLWAFVSIVNSATHDITTVTPQ